MIDGCEAGERHRADRACRLGSNEPDSVGFLGHQDRRVSTGGRCHAIEDGPEYRTIGDALPQRRDVLEVVHELEMREIGNVLTDEMAGEVHDLAVDAEGIQGEVTGRGLLRERRKVPCRRRAVGGVPHKDEASLLSHRPDLQRALAAPALAIRDLDVSAVLVPQSGGEWTAYPARLDDSAVPEVSSVVCAVFFNDTPHT